MFRAASALAGICEAGVLFGGVGCETARAGGVDAVELLGNVLGTRRLVGAVLTIGVIVLGGRGVGSPTNSNTPVRQRQNSSAD